MKLLTRNTDYAVRAICCMASKPGKIFTVTELTDDLKIPRPFLRKILQILNKEGVVRSFRGLGGGFAIAMKPSKIFLSDLMEAFQGPLSINECIFKKRICPNIERCSLKSKIDKIEAQVENELRSVTIGSLIRRKMVRR